ncbi:DUF4168 domain-containing protein [Cecembia rubra]|uniref:Uncharacterized protein DUF4168 n=1 Tax=Cecembia rubra TaxID=1485585 RepID=A0A2P8DYP6_9BACT|nr:DUF4168 domain-containing protein [Cecembia rubra]PSL02343.1 uncharacterized protein DUF4168 [Cecembia rubra]
MIYSKLTSNIFLLFLTLSFSLSSAFAQQLPGQMEVKEDFSDEELKEFVRVNVALIPVQENAQEKMVEAIQSSGLTIDRFQQLAQAQQAGNLRDAVETPEEVAQFNDAGQKVMATQEKMQEEIQKVISDSKLSEQEFQEIYVAYSQSAKVKEKVDEMMDKEFNP